MKRMNEKALREALKLYFVMGSANCREEPAEVLKKAIAGGITMFQFREKGKGALTGAEKFALAEELHDICKKAGIPFIVDDDIPLALALNADGVHIGQEDEPIERAREKIGDRILGVSVHRAEEAKAAIEKGADYLGVGPIFPTKTKEDAQSAIGTGLIRKLRSEGYTIPMVGIGGIQLENAASVMEAGADGVAVISAISAAENVVRAAKTLKECVFY